jgi:hypothetical protein
MGFKVISCPWHWETSFLYSFCFLCLKVCNWRLTWVPYPKSGAISMYQYHARGMVNLGWYLIHPVYYSNSWFIEVNIRTLKLIHWLESFKWVDTMVTDQFTCIHACS